MKTVFVMMSGGVDSSVAAADLKAQGYNVVGVFMKCWSMEQLISIGVDAAFYGCTWEEDAKDARKVAYKLDIPFYTWNLEQEYKQGVVDYMIDEYKKGRTPNPDVMCNTLIKFGVFYDKAVSLGADFVATGHYARIQKTTDGARILRGKDRMKDQSYFVWNILQHKLDKVLMPIGEYDSKKQVRKRAEELGLATALKKDSQGLCFIGKTPMRELLIQSIGNIVDFTTSTILGEHDGAFQYTIGQRHQLGLGGGPWFVKSIDVEKNTVYVLHFDNQAQLSETFLEVENWNLSKFGKMQAQVRYRQQAVNCVVKKNLENNLLEVEFEKPIRAIAAGQSIVFYEDDMIIGGGFIV
jgi:tRNA-uridine 2-sulfurtransferase